MLLRVRVFRQLPVVVFISRPRCYMFTIEGVGVHPWLPSPFGQINLCPSPEELIHVRHPTCRYCQEIIMIVGGEGGGGRGASSPPGRDDAGCVADGGGLRHGRNPYRRKRHRGSSLQSLYDWGRQFVIMLFRITSRLLPMAPILRH